MKSEIPKHIAIIMDGNGRWAKLQNRPRIFGHQAGMQQIKEIALAANQLGVKVLTLFAFSTENWQRPTEEVKFLMKLPIDFFDTFIPELIENGIQVKAIGDINGLPKATAKAVENAIEQTKNGNAMILNFAINYGGRNEIVNATKQISKLVKDQEITIDEIDEVLFSDYLSTSSLLNLANPDLLIRTSGEQRISNFLIWQAAYSEFYFTDKLWPDFVTNDLKAAIANYGDRQRRFGKIEED